MDINYSKESPILTERSGGEGGKIISTCED